MATTRWEPGQGRGEEQLARLRRRLGFGEEVLHGQRAAEGRAEAGEGGAQHRGMRLGPRPATMPWPRRWAPRLSLLGAHEVLREAQHAHHGALGAAVREHQGHQGQAAGDEQAAEHQRPQPVLARPWAAGRRRSHGLCQQAEVGRQDLRHLSHGALPQHLFRLLADRGGQQLRGTARIHLAGDMVQLRPDMVNSLKQNESRSNTWNQTFRNSTNLQQLT